MGLSPDVKMKLGATDHALMGAIAGTVEVTTLQPIIFMKYAVQEGRALPMNPLHYYRGFGVNVVSNLPLFRSHCSLSRVYINAV
jgi:solute carrier family 25 citrate transporter 1